MCRRLVAKPSQVLVLGLTCDVYRPLPANSVAGQPFFEDLRHVSVTPATGNRLTCDAYNVTCDREGSHKGFHYFVLKY